MDARRLAELSFKSTPGPVGQAVHERETRSDLHRVQHGFIRLAGCAHPIHISPGDGGRRTCELAGGLP